MILATCTFRKYTPDMGVPINIALGGPPANLKYPVKYRFSELAPDIPMLRMGFDDFERAYLRILDRLGYDHVKGLIAGALRTERADLDTTPAVLLASGDLTKPGAFCHRTIFAGWWTVHTGALVAELAAMPPDDAYPPLAAPLSESLPIDESGTPAMF